MWLVAIIIIIYLLLVGFYSQIEEVNDVRINNILMYSMYYTVAVLIISFIL